MNIRHAKSLLQKATAARLSGETMDAAQLAFGAQRCALRCRARDKYDVARRAFYLLSDVRRDVRRDAVTHGEKSNTGRMWVEAKTIFLNQGV